MELKYVLGPMRLPFLVLPPACVALGAGTAVWTHGRINVLYLVLAFVGALAAHISVNALNEYYDFQSGLDLNRTRREVHVVEKGPGAHGQQHQGKGLGDRAELAYDPAHAGVVGGSGRPVVPLVSLPGQEGVHRAKALGRVIFARVDSSCCHENS